MNIKDVIKKHGYTQRQVAEMIGVNPGNFSTLVNMRKSSPTPKTLHKIAEAIGADYEEFFADEQPKQMHRKTVEVLLPDGAIDGGIIELAGQKFRQVFYPVDSARLAIKGLNVE